MAGVDRLDGKPAQVELGSSSAVDSVDEVTTLKRTVDAQKHDIQDLKKRVAELSKIEKGLSVVRRRGLGRHAVWSLASVGAVVVTTSTASAVVPRRR